MADKPAPMAAPDRPKPDTSGVERIAAKRFVDEATSRLVVPSAKLRTLDDETFAAGYRTWQAEYMRRRRLKERG